MLRPYEFDYLYDPPGHENPLFAFTFLSTVWLPPSFGAFPIREFRALQAQNTKKGDLAGLLSGPNVQCLPFQLLFPMFPDNLLSGFEVLFARQDSFFRPALSDTSDPVRCDIDRYDPDYLHGAIQQDLHAK